MCQCANVTNLKFKRYPRVEDGDAITQLGERGEVVAKEPPAAKEKGETQPAPVGIGSRVVARGGVRDNIISQHQPTIRVQLGDRGKPAVMIGSTSSYYRVIPFLGVSCRLVGVSRDSGISTQTDYTWTGFP